MRSGTPEERGLIAWADQMKLSKDEDPEAAHQSSTYDFPIGMKLIRRYEIIIDEISPPSPTLPQITVHKLFIFSWKWTSYIPCSPTYKVKL